MRSRSKVVVSKNDHAKNLVVEWNDYDQTETSVIGYDYDFVSKEHTEAMLDVVTPRFGSLKNSGVIVNNPMTQTISKVIDKPFQVYICGRALHRHGESPDYTWDEIGYLNTGQKNTSALAYITTNGLLPAPTLPKQDLIDLAVNKAWSNVSLTEVQTLASLGEARETVTSVVSIFKRLVKILKNIKKGEFARLANEISPRQLADRYMEARYAMRPLYYELKQYSAAFTKETSEILSRLTFRGHENYVDSVSEVVEVPNGDFHGGDRSFFLELETTAECDVRAGVLTELETESKLPAWGLTDVLESAWELVPYSFIVDWFFNVGNTIAAFTPSYGLRPLASWSVVTTTVVQSAKMAGSRADLADETGTCKPLEHVNYLTGGEYHVINVVRERIPNPSRSLTPHVNVRLSGAKLIDLLVIAKNLFR
jgi:hypothetical protein